MVASCGSAGITATACSLGPAEGTRSGLTDLRRAQRRTLAECLQACCRKRRDRPGLWGRGSKLHEVVEGRGKLVVGQRGEGRHDAQNGLTIDFDGAGHAK